MSQPAAEERSFLGHPPGLFVLFFAEMWERFSYYGMRALLIFYMTKGFLAYKDDRAYAVYGAYTALVYATPFIGGMIADRLIGARRAVILGGLLMAAGHLLMTIEQETPFFVALALLICGNGFFKPNISTMVGSMYGAGDDRRDRGFTVFYMGINLGAAMAPLLAGYVGETYGWHYGFGLATIGMLVGLAIFVAPTRVTQGLILATALASAGMMIVGQIGDPVMLAVNSPVALALLVAAGIATAALNVEGLPAEIGSAKVEPPSSTVYAVYGAAFLAVPVIAMLVQNDVIAGYVLGGGGSLALGYIALEAVRSPKVERERLFAVLVMMFFSMLFWAFFEQAGSSISNFTDRNVDRVTETSQITQADVGKQMDVPVTQELLGRPVDGKVYTLPDLDADRKAEKATRTLTITAEHVGMGVGGSELKASVFQAANPDFILLFGIPFSLFWGFLAARKLEPSTPVKFGMGLAQLGLGFGVLWYGCQTADPRGMVGVGWLVLAYMLHTTGELCLSPVGLSMVTRLSPARMVSTVMGGWFLATAFSNYLAGLIAVLTGVGHGEGEEGGIPAPIETLHVYGDVFGQIAVAGLVSALIVFALSPVLRKWMHEDELEPGAGGHGH